MRIVIITLFFLIFLCSDILAQKVSVSDISNFLTISSSAGAEKLLGKGFILTSASNDGTFKTFRYERNSRSISLYVTEEYNFSVSNYIQVCYGKTFQSDFQTLENQVKKNGKKLDFFYGKWFKIYFTEIFYKGMYFYFGKGVCTDNSDNYQNDVFFCSSKSLRFDDKFTF